MRGYTSVNKNQLQRAFALAHQASENAATPRAEREKFKDIARLIWKAHGEQGEPPVDAGDRAAEVARKEAGL